MPDARNKPWTAETVLTHLSALIEANDKRYDAALTAQREAINSALTAADRAIQKAETATEKRFEGVNEFRQTLDNQQRTLITRSEVELMARGIDARLTELKERMDALTNERAGIKGGWGYAVGVVGFVLFLLSIASSVVALLTRR